MNHWIIFISIIGVVTSNLIEQELKKLQEKQEFQNCEKSCIIKEQKGKEDCLSYFLANVEYYCIKVVNELINDCLYKYCLQKKKKKIKHPNMLKTQ
ncbi:unnamed protein product [Paramecium sonneborni]|uniref:Uncharacterized protein n=1 Tax=Paramecium sonneborni TaxID=65129 RepID=A0A8S1PRH0_9CILI|nr:unnamed protein product [Paramecium sonneborni]